MTEATIEEALAITVASKVDLLFASSGIEPEIVGGAADVEVLGVGAIPVALAEDLLAMKVLSMTDRRLQDRADSIVGRICRRSSRPSCARYRRRDWRGRGASRGIASGRAWIHLDPA